MLKSLPALCYLHNGKYPEWSMDIRHILIGSPMKYNYVYVYYCTKSFRSFHYYTSQFHCFHYCECVELNYYCLLGRLPRRRTTRASPLLSHYSLSRISHAVGPIWKKNKYLNWFKLFIQYKYTNGHGQPHKLFLV